MPALAPLKLTFYDPETNEIVGNYICNFIPTRFLKLAIRLSRSLINVNSDTLVGLIVDLFENKFSVDELLRYSEPAERMLVLNGILLRAGNFRSKALEIGSGSAKNKKNKSTDPKDEYWLEDLEIMLIKNLGWSLNEIDNTDVESLFPFVMRYIEHGKQMPMEKLLYIDQVDWL